MLINANTIPSVAHVVLSLANGGLERLVARWTAERNASCPGSTRIFCLDEPGELACELPDGVVRCLEARRAMFPWDRRAVRRLHDWLITDGVQVVHSHNLPAQQYAALATSRTPIAHVYTQHGPGRHNFRFKNTLRSKMLAHVTDRIIAVSHDTARCMTERYGTPAERIEVVPNGIDEHPRFAREDVEALRRELGIKPGDFVFGSLGRLAPVKAWDRFLPVFKELGARSVERGGRSDGVTGYGGDGVLEPPVPRTPILLLVGDGPEMGAIRRQAEDLGISDRVVLPGFRRDARRFLELMDVFLLTSYDEGLSVALLEAMAAGLPIIATDVGDNRAALTPCRAGIILSGRPASWTPSGKVLRTPQVQKPDIGDGSDTFCACDTPLVGSDNRPTRCLRHRPVGRESVPTGAIQPADARLNPFRTTSSWREEIARFIADPAALSQAGARGREYVLANYTAASTTAAYADIYESLRVKYEACLSEYASWQNNTGKSSQTPFGSRTRGEWRQPNIITQLRYHGLTAKLLPKTVRSLIHHLLPATWRDKSIWLASYQNVLRHARPATEKVAGVHLGVVADVMLRHAYYEAACLELGVGYDLIDLIRENWIEEVKASAADVLLIRPFVLHSVGKGLYDERTQIIRHQMGRKVFPGESELWFYESKRRLADWLAVNHVPHPATHVFCRRNEAMDFLETCSYPIVFKTDLGSEALGVRVLKNRRAAAHMVRHCFGRGYRQPRRDHRDKQWGYVIFQDYVPNAREWRVVRIGNSFFGHRKGQEGDFHSGTKLKFYDTPPRQLLDFVRHATDKGKFESMAVDVFETTQGEYLVSEMQVYFGSVNPFLMIVDDRKGRYLYHPDSGEYEFQEGDFCRNNCCNLRVALVLEHLGVTPPMGWALGK